MDASNPLYAFGDFRLDPARRQLLRGGVPQSLTPKAFDVLLLLVQNRERVVDKGEVLRTVWPDTVVEEANLSQNVFTLRKLLGDNAEDAQFIATVPRRGYRFVAPVDELPAEPAAAAPAALESPPAAVPAPAGAAAASPWLRRTALALAFLACVTAAFWAGRSYPSAGSHTFVKMTFRRGVVNTARFAPDGQTILYSAMWDGGPVQAFSMRTESSESRLLDFAEADVAAVSAQGELALVRGRVRSSGLPSAGTLSRVPLSGGAARDLLRDVQEADWGPDGSLAVVRQVGDHNQLEYPLGTVLHRVVRARCIGSPRVAPDGRHVAYIDCENGQPTVVDRQGSKRVLARRPTNALAWASADEVWTSAYGERGAAALYAVSLGGRERELLRVPLPLSLHDVSAQGDVLLTFGIARGGIMAAGPSGEERDLSWFDRSNVADISTDGLTILFNEGGGGGSTNLGAYLRSTSGSPAVRLGDGFALALSPDGTLALARQYKPDGSSDLVLLPTGPGVPRVLPDPGISIYFAQWFPDGRRVLVGGDVPGHGGRLYVLDLGSGAARPLTPEFTGAGTVSPDGRWVASIGSDGAWLYPVEGGERRTPRGVLSTDWPTQWTPDGRGLIVQEQLRSPLRLIRVDLESGARQVWRDLSPADRAGLTGMGAVVSRDGRSYAFTYYRYLTDLFLVRGLR